jgi:hypothetical protein
MDESDNTALLAAKRNEALYTSCTVVALTHPESRGRSQSLKATYQWLFMQNVQNR